MPEPSLVDKVVNLCARRGLVFPTSEAYGAFAGFFDYGPYGVALKRKVERAWWDQFVRNRDDVVGLDGAIIAHPAVWKASGHLDGFNDLLTECSKCRNRFRADQLIESALKIPVDGLPVERIQQILNENKLVCPACKSALTPVAPFNLMFKTHVGALADETSAAYLRPETAQSIFASFKTLHAVSRKALPFGIAQVGKAFRNEISPRNFVFRAREFTQMELEYFLHPGKLNDCPALTPDERALRLSFYTAAHQEQNQAAVEMAVGEALDQGVIATAWHAYWLAQSAAFFLSLGVRRENLRVRQHVKTELSHYSAETWDVEYKYSFGWKEVCGIANRGSFDLTQHAAASGRDLGVFDQASGEKVVPAVIEPSFGLDRALFTLLLDAYAEKQAPATDGTPGETSVVLKLHASIAPVTVGVFPLMKKDGLAEKARAVHALVRGRFDAEYDEAGSIGKRYARHDEIGTPWCVTVDHDSLERDDVTVRERDSGRQARVPIAGLPAALDRLLGGAKLEAVGASLS